ncbi:MAG TPA: quinone-dependent dihydroorotate dehydrogenase [Microbacteriaceae bacterium]|nr:quinone-dependent dihydroorotate dehydrogenase [Microbacteriaceae bacterium]
MRTYPWVFKTFLAKLDPEKAHHLAFAMIRFLNIVPCVAYRFTKADKRLQVNTLGLTFPSPFGLAAGFDKNAVAVTGLAALGFGHVEVGTLTAHPQPGNSKPRLFRLVKDHALINRMGFNNNGSETAVKHLQKARMRTTRPIIGVNIGKSKVTPVDQAITDYVLSAQRLAPLADYVAVNVSSPNTPGLRGLQELDQLEPLLNAVRGAVADKPLLVKIAPDMDDKQIKGIVQLANKLGLDGIIATNTTVMRDGLATSDETIKEIGAGGLSGKPLASRSLEVLKLIRSVAPTKFCVISVGGVSTAKDVHERLEAGATLVQGYSAFVYEGPMWAKKINQELKSYTFGR